MARFGNCGSCYYYKLLGSNPQPQCVVRPPSIFVHIAPAPTDQDPTNVIINKFTAYPTPDGEWGCGEHEPEEPGAALPSAAA